MSFFSVFMLVLGILNMLMIIFAAACRLNPRVLKNKTINEVYNFIVGNDVYEIE